MTNYRRMREKKFCVSLRVVWLPGSIWSFIEKYWMSNSFMPEKDYSTIKSITTELPIIENRVEDSFEILLFLPRNDERQGEGGLRTKGFFKKSDPRKPLVSIVTVIYNGEKYIEKTIQSVLHQSYDNVEYIIIDGGSTDKTLDIIKKYDKYIDYWVSEPDEGIYDAMNKGLSLCNGAIIGIINADDWYETYAVKLSVDALEKQNGDYTCGSVRKIPSELLVRPICPMEAHKIYQGMMYPHVSAFIRKDIYQKVGKFDTRYKIAADFDMAMRIHLHGYKAICINKVLATVVEGGISANGASSKEYMAIAVAHGKSHLKAYKDYFIQRAKQMVVKVLPKKLIGSLLRLKKSRFQYDNS